MAEYESQQESRVRVNIERTASNKVTRSLTYREGMDKTEAATHISDAVDLFCHLETEMSKARLIESPSSTTGV